MDPFVTVIVPCYNEAKYIATVLENILQQDYPSGRVEIFIADGMSTDGTREIIEGFRRDHPQIRIIDNEKRFVPFGLNRAIRESRGEVIVRMDAHAHYPLDYIRVLVKYLFQLDADNVGGVWIINPANDSVEAEAISFAQSSIFGVGNARYRVGAKGILQTDTVPFGCFKRSVFDRVGMYDEDLLRNQDDELNARITQNNGRIFLVPEVAINYFARSKVRMLLRMFYQYSLFKPLVNTKLKRPATVRQFAPPLFLLYLAAGWLPALISPLFLYPYTAILAFYLLLDLYFSFRGAVERKRASLLLYLPWMFFLQHVTYGAGYLHGIFRFVILKREPGVVSSTR